MTLHTTDFPLFPTRLLTLEIPDAAALNQQILELFARPEFQGDFDMHPDSLNLLGLAHDCPALARIRDYFLQGLRQWLRAEGIQTESSAEMVLFCNIAERGDFTLVHNHNADVVGVYYVQTADHSRPPVSIPTPEGDYDYFAAEDGVLVLHDPRFNANLAALRSTDYAKVYPHPGLMLIFPAYVWHSVTPHLGTARRLSIAVNFTLTSKRTTHAETWPI